jgi:hypothetical protein
VAYHLLRKFNEGAIRFLLCTSTIIEGVNTSAKNIVIYDNKIATKKFDLFTFNNIKGRAGRMLKHFVGHVYVLHPEPQPELPIVDFPSLTQPPDIPESLLIQLDQHDLSERSKEQLRYLHAQEILPIEIMKTHAGIEPRQQLDLATELTREAIFYHPLLAWSGYPTADQLKQCCELIFTYLMGGRGHDGVVSSKQLYFFISRFLHFKSIPALFREELNNAHTKDPSEAIERVLKFLRQWCEFHFPRYLGALDQVQRSVFDRAQLKTGNYERFAGDVKHLFMHPAVTTLEEFGLPYTVTAAILSKYQLGQDVDSIIFNLKRVPPSGLDLTRIEQEMFADTLKNI